MRKHYLVIASVVVALGMAFWLWPKSGTKSGTSSESKSSSSEIDKRRDARRSGQFNSTPASISGRVVSAETGEPLAGSMVSLALRKIDGGLVGSAGESSAPLATQTDADGRYKVDNLNPGRYSVSTSTTGYLPKHIDGLLLEGGEAKSDIDFALQEGGQLVTGVVTDIGGGPVGFAFVRARKNSEFTVSSFFRAPLTATTNAQGEYQLNLGDGNYSFDVFHEDYRAERRNINIGGQARRVDFVLTPGSVIEGVVRMQGDDSLVPGATVTWNKMGRSGGFVISGITMNGSAVSDDDGKFTLRGLGSGALELRAQSTHSSSREPTIVELSIAETVSDVVVYVDSAFMVSGFVVNKGPEKQAAGDVMLGAYSLSPGALYSADTPSASDGYFEIHGVQPGSYTVGALAEEKLPNPFGDSITVVDKDLTDIVVTVDGGFTLSGTVTPPQETTITLEVDMQEVGFSNMLQAVGSFLVRTRSAPDGSFTLKGVGKGNYSLVATAKSGDRGSSPVEVAEDISGVVVDLEARASASGIVVDEGGHPVEGVEVRFEAKKKKPSGSIRMGGPNAQGNAAITGADGRFVQVGLEDGSFGISVYDGAQLAWAGTSGDARNEPIALAIVEARDHRDLRLVVEARSHGISGTVQDPEGNLLADAWVTATRVDDVGAPQPDGDDDQQGRWRGWQAAETPVLTNVDGEFKIETLRSGLYDLVAEATQGGAKGKVTRVKMDTRVNIRVEQLGKLSGKVTQAGSPVEQYVLSVDGPQRRRIQVARENGSFALPRLEAGEYSVEVTSKEGVASAKATVNAGEEAIANIQLAAFGSVSGTLIDAMTGDPIPNISAVATMDRDRSKFAANAIELMTGVGPSTGSEGDFRVGKLGAGEGVIYFMDSKSKGFHIIATKEFTLTPGQSIDLGEIPGRKADTVPEDKRGTLGLMTQVATRCPFGEDEGESGEDDGDDQEQRLWIYLVKDGPAERAGAELCDEVTSVNGMEVATVGPEVLKQVLRMGLEVGKTYTIGVNRASGPTTLSIVVAHEDSDEPSP